MRTPDGVLAGSNLSLDRAVRNLVAFTGCTPAEAISTVTRQPRLGCSGSTTGAGSQSVRGPTSSCSTPTLRVRADVRWGVSWHGGRDHRRRRCRRRARRRRVIAGVLDDTPGTRARAGDGQLTARRLSATDRGAPCAASCRSPHASAVLLDEYVGLPPDHPEAYRAFIRRRASSTTSTSRPSACSAPMCTPTIWPTPVPALRPVDRRSRRRRPATARDRQRRPRRLQRARLVARLADAHQDPDACDPRRQRPLLRRPRSRRCRATS